MMCDAYDAMTSERPYREPTTPPEAVVELPRCAGTQFDPEVVEVLVEVLSEHDAALEAALAADPAPR